MCVQSSATDVHNFIEGHTGLDTRSLQHVQEIIGRNIAGRRRRKRTATDAANAGIEVGHAGLDGGERVGEPGITRVVEVTALRNAANDLLHAT